MTRFDDDLWREIERRYGSELAGADGPLTPAARGRLPVIAGASLGVAGASAAAVVVLGAAGSPPAYAVTTHPDGTVSVMIRRIDGIAGANQRLAQLGIRVRAVLVNARCQASVAPALRRVTVATVVRDRGAGWVGGVNGGVDARIRPTQIARHRTLVIAAVLGRGQVRLVRGRAVRGAVPSCLPPVAQLVSGGRGGKPRVVSCGAAQLLSKPPVVVSPGTNTTATDETTSTGPRTGSTTTPGPVTTSATATTAGTATAVTTGSGTKTNWQTTTGPSPARPRGVTPPPIVQSCIAAARRARLDRNDRASAKPTG